LTDRVNVRGRGESPSKKPLQWGHREENSVKKCCRGEKRKQGKGSVKPGRNKKIKGGPTHGGKKKGVRWDCRRRKVWGASMPGEKIE